MKKSTGFLLGIGAGVAAGAVAGMMAPQNSRRTVKKQVDQGIRKLGTAMEQAADSAASAMG